MFHLERRKISAEGTNKHTLSKEHVHHGEKEHANTCTWYLDDQSISLLSPCSLLLLRGNAMSPSACLLVLMSVFLAGEA